jgi:hypothetical protein
MNTKIKTGSMFLLAAVLVAGTISMVIPSSFAQPYAPDPYAKDPYAMEKPQPKNVNVQKINCINSNVNVNGVDVNQLPPQNGDPTAFNPIANSFLLSVVFMQISDFLLI